MLTKTHGAEAPDYCYVRGHCGLTKGIHCVAYHQWGVIGSTKHLQQEWHGCIAGRSQRVGSSSAG